MINTQSFYTLLYEMINAICLLKRYKLEDGMYNDNHWTIFHLSELND